MGTITRNARKSEVAKDGATATGAPDSDNEDWDDSQWPEEKEDGPVKEEDDSLEDEDLAFITSVLESFSTTKSKATKLNEPF
jgi:hypothetical protein